jgi:hypothetical protein
MAKAFFKGNPGNQQSQQILRRAGLACLTSVTKYSVSRLLAEPFRAGVPNRRRSYPLRATIDARITRS